MMVMVLLTGDLGMHTLPKKARIAKQDWTMDQQGHDRYWLCRDAEDRGGHVADGQEAKVGAGTLSRREREPAADQVGQLFEATILPARRSSQGGRA